MVNKKDSAFDSLTKIERNLLLNKTVGAYTNFLDNGKTPQLTVQRAIDMAQKFGLEEYNQNKSQEGFYMTDLDKKQIALVMYGERTANEGGISFLGAHTDAPCLNLKPKPIIEGPEGVVLATKPYGGIWDYQHLDYQATLIGHVLGKADFTLEGMLSDRGIHISHKIVEPKKVSEAFPHEMLKFVTGYANEKNFLKKLKKSGIEEKDFFRGSWYVVPSANSRIIGDGLIEGYGHDDRICLFASLNAALNSKNREFPTIIYGCDKEEIGSTGLSGAQSPFIDSAVYALLESEGIHEKDISPALLNRIYTNSKMISSDVDIALTSYDGESQDEKIASRFNRGIALIKTNGGAYQSGGNSASDSLTSYFMNLFELKKVMYQMSELPTKLQSGGGGTISKYFAHRGIPVIDIGVAVGNMHGKTPLAHVGDLGQLIKGYKAFIERRD